MPAYVIYLDQVLMGSLVMNYAILWVVARFTSSGSGHLRLLGAAALGSFYSVAVFMPGLAGLLTFWHKALVSLLIVYLAFGWRNPRNFITCLGCFYLTSFTLGGAVWGFLALLQGSTVANQAADYWAAADQYVWYGVLPSLATCWLIGKKWPLFMRRRSAEHAFGVGLTISILGRQARVPAMVDTGNHLTDPLTGRPVIVVEYSALSDILPREFYSGHDNQEGVRNLSALLESLGSSPWAARFRPIPFRSLGLDHGLLPGFRPDSVLIEQGEQFLRTKDVVIAVCNRPLHEQGYYRALVNPVLMVEKVSA